MTPEARHAALQNIAQEIEDCTKCPLHQGRTKTVPGDGSMGADILFIGEGPGYYEDQRGLPFVGASGRYLEELLGMVGLTRQDVFITNVVKCRPPSNRDPMPDEIGACRDYLDRQIELIDPIAIATLGRFSMARYFPGGKITQIHGKPKFADGRIYFPFFHPAAALRNQHLKPQMEEDFKRLIQLVKDAKAGNLAELGGEGNPSQNDPEPPQQLSLF